MPCNYEGKQLKAYYASKKWKKKLKKTKKKKGWKSESTRHALARKGVKTKKALIKMSEKKDKFVRLARHEKTGSIRIRRLYNDTTKPYGYYFIVKGKKWYLADN